MSDNQARWNKLVKELGDKEARKFLAEKLREAANQVEKRSMPDVFGCEFKEVDPNAIYQPFIWTVAVTLSYPWPG
ncbi:MAG: hypothetical protein WC358_10910 [Ignavibacteria bacterium]|jgi:anaerobic glycerol-3-phosphate dehydrogenase